MIITSSVNHLTQMIAINLIYFGSAQTFLEAKNV